MPLAPPAAPTHQPTHTLPPSTSSHPRSPWVLGLASVLFDVDKGQTLTDIWPPDVLSEEERAAVAFHAFPVSGGPSRGLGGCQADTGAHRRRRLCVLLALPAVPCCRILCPWSCA
jgi:hypothetical protein